MDGSAVKYKNDYYPTERHHLVINMVKSDGDFDGKKDKLKHERKHGVNELLISWNDADREVTKYAIDGEEMDVE